MLIRQIIVLLVIFFGCSSEIKKDLTKSALYSLEDFFSENNELDRFVDSIFNQLIPKARIAQMIVVAGGKTGKPTRAVEKLISKNSIGGVLMLSGKKNELVALRHHFDSLSRHHGNLPLIYSSDAEPSLINRKIKGTQIVPKTVNLKTIEKCDSVTQIISSELLSMGIQHNYAPVVDLSPDNEAITNRTFGNDSATVVELSSTFINTSQRMGIAATAKHFPGHGLVSGDTHNQLVTIDGEMKEVNNYVPLIEQGVLSIMVGHIAVVNNEKYGTHGLPASCSSVIVTDLLKNQLGFEGLVITDAMNMGALRKIGNASLKAVEAGCDLILMEPNEIELMDNVHKRYLEDDAFKTQINQSVKKILRLKACMNLF